MKSIRLQVLNEIKRLSENFSKRELKHFTLNLIRLQRIVNAYQRFVDDYSQIIDFNDCAKAQGKKFYTNSLKCCQLSFCALKKALHEEVSDNFINNLYSVRK